MSWVEKERMGKHTLISNYSLKPKSVRKNAGHR